MRYYFIRIYYKKNEQGEIEEKIGTPVARDSRFEAEQKFYTMIGQDMSDESIMSELCVVMNSTGAVEMSYKWTRPIIESVEPAESEK